MPPSRKQWPQGGRFIQPSAGLHWAMGPTSWGCCHEQQPHFIPSGCQQPSRPQVGQQEVKLGDHVFHTGGIGHSRRRGDRTRRAGRSRGTLRTIVADEPLGPGRPSRTYRSVCTSWARGTDCSVCTGWAGGTYRSVCTGRAGGTDCSICSDRPGGADCPICTGRARGADCSGSTGCTRRAGGADCPICTRRARGAHGPRGSPIFCTTHSRT